MDVVVRTRNVGHFFPSGTIDAQEVWLEFRAEDAAGRPFFWSGFTGEAGEAADAPVDPSAHFFRSLLLDERGNPINKRNAWAARSLLTSPRSRPGAAHTVRYRLRVPGAVEGPVTLTARLNYRKFDWWHTQWTFRGELDETGDVASGYDDRAVRFADDVTAPDVPIVEMATASLELPVAAEASRLPRPRPAASPARCASTTTASGCFSRGTSAPPKPPFPRCGAARPRVRGRAGQSRPGSVSRKEIPRAPGKRRTRPSNSPRTSPARTSSGPWR